MQERERERERKEKRKREKRKWAHNDPITPLTSNSPRYVEEIKTGGEGK
jgi:hypothetical protein